MLATPRHFAYIKIAEGCDHPCTFCVIPQYRGTFRSRRFETVISEATRLFRQGVREINLIGQDTTCYGEDLGLKDGLAHLLARLAQIETARREVDSLPLRLSEQGHAEAARHHRRTRCAGEVHRHAAAARQRAGAEAHEARRARGHLPEADRAHPRTIPGVAIRTSFIVGFPGETEEDFEELCEFVEAAQFDHLGVFSYSDEDTSASYHLDGKVDGRTIQNRKRRLMAIQRKISARGNAPGGTRVARAGGRPLEGDRPAVGRPPVHAGAGDRRRHPDQRFRRRRAEPGEIRRLRITEAHDYDVVGALIDAREDRPTALNPAAPS